MYREYEPPEAEAVRCVWTSTKVGVQRVIPDGCMDIIFNGENLVVAGPDTEAFLTEATGTGVGVRFQPGVAPGFLGIPAHAIKNTRVPLAELWPTDRVHRLLGELHRGKPGRSLLRAVQSAEPDRFANRVRQLVASGDVRGMADELGITERHLHRKCLAKFGYGPKTLQRIVRFSAAMERVYAGKPFAEVAYEAGYADQAHFSRDVKALAGATLTTLVQDADVTR
ncbi:helix-turn-helix domain-containing protein [Kibdelosporangium persicum]|uniref:Helix-turn-helix transcriptional regulator n=1 Tax=Kibdelosporangium persicum TaxID=2698649 RepID=A0ABX2EZ98_9PSEU|nr:helix-turn-helix domain-containing protein [Kibdelosporangium persicum]NRN64375.1 Helix-turn-helix transcriptional regulator [Kibdelosporangium persicum]